MRHPVLTLGPLFRDVFLDSNFGAIVLINLRKSKRWNAERIMGFGYKKRPLADIIANVSITELFDSKLLQDGRFEYK